MPRIIYKDTHPIGHGITLELPQSAELLHVADQEGHGRQLDFWSLVPPGPADEPMRERVVLVFPTGEPIHEGELQGFAHWTTVVSAGGTLVWHVFLDFDGARSIPAGR